VSEKECSFDLGGSFSSSRAGSSTLISTPQHERLLAESVARSRAPPKRLSFEAGDVHHGERMKEINDGNLDYWDDHSISFVHQANRSNSARKRMFHELKTIHKAGVPFISATPVGDNLGRILASIEGPPETPYEGGIFWILVSASQATPPGAPNIRFHTKVYHPNIDHRTGILCADFEQKWGPANVPASLRGHFAESIALWSERTSPDMWSLLALLIAICGLLASPNAADPLVPDIAQKYIEDPDGYYEAAKKWTEQYAKASEKPNEDTLRFPGEPSDAIDSKTADHNDQGPDLEEIVDSLLLCDAEQSHLRQFTGDSLSKIEQWRMVREMRLALDRELHRTAPSATWELISSLGFWTDSRIRTLIRESANRQSNKATSEMQLRYLITLKSSFGCTDKFESPPEKNHEDRSPHQVILAVESNGKYSGKSDQATAVAPALVGSTVFPSPTTAAPAPSPGDTGPSTIASSVPEGSSNSPNGNLSKDSTPSKAFVDTSRPEPWPPYQPYCTTDTSGITTYASPRVFTPRYTSNGYYATRSSPRRKQTRSTSHNEAKRRSSYAYRTPYVKSDEKEYEYVDYMVGGVFYRVPAHRPRKSTYNYRGHGTDRHYYSQQPRTERPTTSAKKTPPTPKATEADAWRNRIPPGYSLKNWDPTEEPIMLFGSVFDANSLGKWIYDWTVYHHGSATPLADLAGELWHLLIQLAGKIKRAEECMPRIREVEDREMAEEFIESGERLMGKLKKILKACETPILKAGKKHNKEGAHLGKNAGTEFVDSIFGRDRQLESTEKFMSSIRLWSLRFDANCEDILRNYASRNKALVPLHSHGKTIQTNTEVAILLMKPVAIRTTFGLEDIAEEPASLKDEWFSFSTSKKDKKKKAKVAVREKTKAGKTLPDTVIDDVDFGFGISRKDKKAKHNAVNGEDMPKHSGTDLKVGFEDDLNWGGWWSIPTKGKGKVADAEDLSKESHLTSKPAERDRADWGAWGASTKITEAQGEDSSLNVEDLSNKSDLLTNHDVGWAAWSFAPRKGKDLNVEGTPRENDSTPKLDDDVDRVDWGFGAKIEKKEGGPAPGRQDLSEDMKGIKADLKVIA
jgi:ubiquitin-protein ligase